MATRRTIRQTESSQLGTSLTTIKHPVSLNTDLSTVTRRRQRTSAGTPQWAGQPVYRFFCFNPSNTYNSCKDRVLSKRVMAV
ncbi:unnamed protein product [Pieris macdunnoughi]|uniref:Uncharacterized protein n=1 Tax=Pieris macdunnoughi TaxID=345717 RepID=A0A821XK25_9NEOP|nr:unnamed protein product [Pieris macdunnoughi]